MKISKQTLAVLKNFASINGSILIIKGNEIVTVSPARNIFARFSCAEDFPVNIPLYDINDLLSSLSLFEDPEIDFKEKNMVITGDGQKMKYVYSDESVVSAAPKISETGLKNPKVQFKMGHSTLDKILKASNVTGGDTITLSKKGNDVSVIAKDINDPDSNTYEIKIEGIEYDGNFNIMILTDNFKMLPLDYEVNMFDNFIQFKNEASKIDYIIASENESVWG